MKLARLTAALAFIVALATWRRQLAFEQALTIRLKRDMRTFSDDYQRWAKRLVRDIEKAFRVRP